MMYKASCPICQSGVLTDFLHRENVPIHQNLVMPSLAQARALSKGTLLMSVCQSCGFIFNRAFNEGLMNYSMQYNNNQSFSQSFLSHMQERITYLKEQKHVKGKTVVEVGCGKGDFLTQLIMSEGTNKGYGFDPSYQGEANPHEALVFVRDYFSDAYHSVQGDVCICRHVIEHIEQPVAFLEEIRKGLCEKNARYYFETPCVDWIVRHGATWDFFYEHCSYFSRSTLLRAFSEAGISPLRATTVFGDQYLWGEGSARSSHDTVVPQASIPDVTSIVRADKQMMTKWQTRLQALVKKGNVAIWGAGAKGVTFAHLFDPDVEHINCVIDINPGKNGGYLPGTGHLIIGLEQLQERNIATVIIMNPNYVEESKIMLQEQKLTPDLIVLGGSF
ncbi:ndp-hexose methyltransferase [Fictibacillus macauensis ZFHKF-1]|uniref:Ndp-hexose methyltransferase n=1 Tax=Fictibacillus macauensis ZFHKF-1 TaxID=1196324 RepID=I8AG53_9BACL|nr:class I SAM-dependent methyltransferase [Fictibacillus macauensis]EIT84627.1 ndp-hexose methyltransferase [Fictibacillus macauensis ZFHKF-1]